MNDSSALALFMVLGSFMVVLFIIGIICYVLAAIGLMKAAQNAGVENAWLAWIPIANMYVVGKIVKELSIGSYKITNPEVILPVGAIATAILNFIPVIGWILSIAYVILTLIALFKLYRLYNDKNAVLYLVLSIIIPFLVAFFLFSLRNKTPDYSLYA